MRNKRQRLSPCEAEDLGNLWLELVQQLEPLDQLRLACTNRFFHTLVEQNFNQPKVHAAFAKNKAVTISNHLSRCMICHCHTERRNPLIPAHVCNGCTNDKLVRTLSATEAKQQYFLTEATLKKLPTFWYYNSIYNSECRLFLRIDCKAGALKQFGSAEAFAARKLKFQNRSEKLRATKQAKREEARQRHEQVYAEIARLGCKAFISFPPAGAQDYIDGVKGASWDTAQASIIAEKAKHEAKERRKQELQEALHNKAYLEEDLYLWECQQFFRGSVPLEAAVKAVEFTIERRRKIERERADRREQARQRLEALGLPLDGMREFHHFIEFGHGDLDTISKRVHEEWILEQMHFEQQWKSRRQKGRGARKDFRRGLIEQWHAQKK